VVGTVVTAIVMRRVSVGASRLGFVDSVHDRKGQLIAYHACRTVWIDLYSTRLVRAERSRAAVREGNKQRASAPGGKHLCRNMQASLYSQGQAFFQDHISIFNFAPRGNLTLR
jgi:hypothetical protein